MATKETPTDRAFRALADPTRRAILDLVRDRALPVGEISQGFPVSRPAISKHLRLLREAGLVNETRKGRERCYRAVSKPLEAAAAWLASQLGAAPAGPQVAARAPRRPAAKPSTAGRGPQSSGDWQVW